MYNLSVINLVKFGKYNVMVLGVMFRISQKFIILLHAALHFPAVELGQDFFFNSSAYWVAESRE